MKRLWCGLLIALGAATSGAQAPLRHEFTQVHMGVPVRLVLYTADSARAREGAQAAYGLIANLDAALSDYRPDSELRRLEAGARRWFTPSDDLFAVLTRAVEISRATDGAFDPTTGALTRLWREARTNNTLPDSAAVGRARRTVGWHHILIDSSPPLLQVSGRGTQLDVGGIAKGYILQQAFEVLRALDLRSVLLEAGGDIVVGDAPPGEQGWRIVVGDSSSVQSVTNVAVATSGSREQHLDVPGARYSHVIDPRTGWGVRSRAEVTVIAADGATADAVATALSVLGPGRTDEVVRRVPAVISVLWR
jgi:thiamine biosynthesis lipoprotein